jgi:hypothetical protein
MLFKKNMNAILIIVIFFLFCYIYASWQSWYLGCSYGCRAMVDLYPIIFFPLFVLIKNLKKVYVKILFYLSLSLFALFNLNLMLAYTSCFFGVNDWDWYEYNSLICDGVIYTTIFNNKGYNEKYDYIVTLKDCNNKYVCSDANFPDVPLYANKDKACEMEQFKLVAVDSNRITLKSFEDLYVGPDENSQNTLFANRKKRGFWEIFTIVKLLDKKIAIKTYKGNYISIDQSKNGLLISDRNEIGLWETFTMDTLEFNNK